MVKRKADRRIIKIVKKYINAVRKDYTIDGAYLFGSFATGNFRDESDIDVAILLKDYENRVLERVNLGKYTRGIDTRIEPHPIKTADFENRASMMAREVIRTGIRIV